MRTPRVVFVAIVGGTLASLAGAARGESVSFSIDPTQSLQAISPYIYGTNGADNPADNFTLFRAGGNRWTAYNWMNNYSNAGSDYLYENDQFLDSSTTPGDAVRPLVTDAASRGAASLLTIPINGYVAADASGPVDPTVPPQDSPHFVPEFPTESADPSPAANHVYQDQYVSLLKSEYPSDFSSNSKTPIFFDLDNEPGIWDTTHPEVHPQPATYAEMISKSTAYAAAIKSVAPNALVFGPVSYGWEDFENLQSAPDSGTFDAETDPNTGKPYGDFLSYYLAQMNAASKAAGTRLLDVADIHWYPEATGANAEGVQTRITVDDNSPGVVAARLQAPRSLWDPTYSENSFITNDTGSGPIQLIPRIQTEINANNPGTKISISEYNYGGGDNISGGIAEADVLGIFGKQGVFSAAEWPLLSSEPFIDAAFQMFRNYDGKDSTFGDTSVQASNSNTVDTSIYASIDSADPRKMVLVAINKTGSAVTANMTLSHAAFGSAVDIYQLTSADAAPVFAGTLALGTSTSFAYSMPADSVSTLVVTVPEPAGVGLVIAGVMGMGRRRRAIGV